RQGRHSYKRGPSAAAERIPLAFEIADFGFPLNPSIQFEIAAHLAARNGAVDHIVYISADHRHDAPQRPLDHDQMRRSLIRPRRKRSSQTRYAFVTHSPFYSITVH